MRGVPQVAVTQSIIEEYSTIISPVGLSETHVDHCHDDRNICDPASLEEGFGRGDVHENGTADFQPVGLVGSVGHEVHHGLSTGILELTEGPSSGDVGGDLEPVGCVPSEGLDLLYSLPDDTGGLEHLFDPDHVPGVGISGLDDRDVEVDLVVVVVRIVTAGVVVDSGTPCRGTGDTEVGTLLPGDDTVSDHP